MNSNTVPLPTIQQDGQIVSGWKDRRSGRCCPARRTRRNTKMPERSATGPAAIRSGAPCRAAARAGVSGRLRTIFVKLQGDIGCVPTRSGRFARWARQGVLLLNAVPTVEEGRPGSHARKGWEVFTDSVVEALVCDVHPRVLLLWGAYAQAKQTLIDAERGGRLVLTANHPSPLSARRPPQPFLGCPHFSQANAFLVSRGRGGINWCRSVGRATRMQSMRARGQCVNCAALTPRSKAAMTMGRSAFFVR